MLAFILLGGEARAWGDVGHKVIVKLPSAWFSRTRKPQSIG
jgi:hypothetical protein